VRRVQRDRQHPVDEFGAYQLGVRGLGHGYS
jgi:hypothetical protein